MNKPKEITVAAMAVVAVAGGILLVGCSDQKVEAAGVNEKPAVELAQATPASAVVAEPDAAVAAEAAGAEEEGEAVALDRDPNEAPEITKVSAQLVQGEAGTPVSGGVVYFVFQNRLNEIPHANPMEKIVAMAEEAVAVDSEGSFTLKMKPGNFALVYDPNATEVPTEPGPESMSVMKKLTPEQVQARISAIKENAAKGLPIENGKIGNAFVIENRFIRPPVSNFGQLQLQAPATVTVKAIDGEGELISFPATLRLRGKNGDIMEPHTPSISTRAQYEFHDLMPQSYQVFALGTLPRPGAGDEITTPSVQNDQLVFTGESLTHEAVVELPSAE